MSNVVTAIIATDTGNRRVIPVKSTLFQDVFKKTENLSEVYHAGEFAKVYKIGITIGDQVMVSELDAIRSSENNALSLAIERTKEQVIEAIFGEFRQDFRIIERHLYNYDFEKAATAVRAMETKMFSTE